MAKKKAKQWESETLKEVTINGQSWRAQKLTAPDGTEMFGIRAFYVNKDGKELTLRHGFTLPADVCTPKNVSRLNKLLKAIHAEVSDE